LANSGFDIYYFSWRYCQVYGDRQFIGSTVAGKN